MAVWQAPWVAAGAVGLPAALGLGAKPWLVAAGVTAGVLLLLGGVALVLRESARRRRAEAAAAARTHEVRDLRARLQVEGGERLLAQQRLRQLDRAVEQSPVAIVITDLEGTIEYVNPAFVTLTGYTAAEAGGRNPRILKSELTPASVYEDLWRTMLAGRVWQGEFVNRRKSGELYHERSVMAPVQDSDGRITHFLALKEDITERKRTEEALLAKSHAIASALNGIAFADLEGRLTSVNAAFLSMWGYERESEVVGQPVTGFWASEEEVGRVVEALRSRGCWEGEMAAIRRGGARFDVLVSAHQVPRDDGRPLGMMASFLDISVRKQASDELRRLNHELGELVSRLRRSDHESTLVNRLSDALQSCQDTGEACRVIELAMSELFPARVGWLAVVDARRQVFEIVAAWGGGHEDEAVFSTGECWALRRGHLTEVPDPPTALVCRHLAPGGLGGYLCLPLIVQGESLGLLHLKAGASGDAGESRQLAVTVGESIKLSLSNLRLRDVLREQSVRDPLTGLNNRRFLDEVLPRELRRCLRRGAPLTLAMVDLDHFKRFNDTHGHQAGDRLLRQVAGLLQDTMRAVDVVCRFGGEEFVLVLPDSPVLAVVPRLEALRARARELRPEVDGSVVAGVSLSVGVAQAPDHGSSQEDILRAADRALYAAKESGRDRLVVFRPA